MINQQMSGKNPKDPKDDYLATQPNSIETAKTESEGQLDSNPATKWQQAKRRPIVPATPTARPQAAWPGPHVSDVTPNRATYWIDVRHEPASTHAVPTNGHNLRIPQKLI